MIIDDLIQEMGIFDTIQRCLAVTEADDALDACCARLVANIGGEAMINGEMRQLLAALRAGDVKAANDSMEALNVLLMAHLEDPDSQLEAEDQLWPALMEQLQRGIS